MFVGNIYDGMADIVLRQILSLFGNVQGWNRIREPSGKLGSFGFCDYDTPESTLRALRILNEMTVEGQHFNLNVDQKNKSSLEAYLQAQGRTPDLYNTNDGGIKHADDKTIESIKELIRDTAATLKVEFRVPRPAPVEKVEKPADATEAAIVKELKSAREAATNSPSVDEQAAKKLEREKTRREEQFKDAVRSFQSREKNRIQDLKYEEEKEKTREADRAREAVRQKNFFANYNDERDDTKFYKPAFLMELKREREREMEWEEKDKAAEALEPKPESPALKTSASESGKIGFGLGFKAKVVAPTSRAPTAAFHAEEDDNADLQKKRKLVKIEYSEEELRARGVNPEEERKKAMKRVIESIPTKTEELFAAAIEWEVVDEPFVKAKIEPWVKKKIIQFIGEEEPTLVEFICTKVKDHSDAKTLLSDLGIILDEEAESFVVKLWRLLHYEIQAKKLGLPSQS